MNQAWFAFFSSTKLFFLLQNCISVRPTRLGSIDTLGNVLTSISGAVLTDNTRVTLFPSPTAQLVVHFLHAMNMNIWSPLTLHLIKCFLPHLHYLWSSVFAPTLHLDVSTSTTLRLIVYLHSSLHRSDKNVSARVIVMETDVHLRPERVETTVTAGYSCYSSDDKLHTVCWKRANLLKSSAEITIALSDSNTSQWERHIDIK